MANSERLKRRRQLELGQGPVFELRIHQRDQLRTQHVAGKDVLVVGRSRECDVVIDERYVSSRHVKILHGVVVEDLASLNGTFLDGERLKGAASIAGRTIRLGFEEDDIGIEVVTSESLNPETPAGRSTADDGPSVAPATLQRLAGTGIGAFHATLDGSTGRDLSGWLLAEALTVLRRVELSLDANRVERGEGPGAGPNLDQCLSAILSDPLSSTARRGLRDYLSRMATDFADDARRTGS